MTISSCTVAFLSTEAGYENFPLKNQHTKTPELALMWKLFFSGAAVCREEVAHPGKWRGNGERQDTLLLKVTRHHQKGTKAEEFLNLSDYLPV